MTPLFEHFQIDVTWGCCWSRPWKDWQIHQIRRKSKATIIIPVQWNHRATHFTIWVANLHGAPFDLVSARHSLPQWPDSKSHPSGDRLPLRDPHWSCDIPRVNWAPIQTCTEYARKPTCTVILQNYLLQVRLRVVVTWDIVDELDKLSRGTS